MKKEISKIALFGGSFDPPHSAHDKIVHEILRNLNIDLLIIMPTFINPFKKDFSAPPVLRLKWCKILWQDLPKTEICDFEVLHGRPIATIESVKFLKSKFPKIKKFYLIIGADNLKDLKKWQNYEELQNLTEFIVATRNDKKVSKHLKKININDNISSSLIRAGKFENIPEKIKSEVIKFYKGKIMVERAERIAKILEDKKAENVEIIDMSNRDYIAKFVVIATTLAAKHGETLIEELKTELKPFNEKFLGIESSDEWSVIDFGDIIVHLMSETYRQKYNIEEFLEKLKKEQTSKL